MDELQRYLKTASPDNIIIGEPDCNLLIVGYEENRITNIKTILLTVGCPDITDTDTCINELRLKYRNNNTFKNLFDHGKKLSEIAAISFVMVAYKSKNPDEITEHYLNSMNFVSKQIYPEQTEPQMHSSDGFVSYVYGLLGNSFTDAGTCKSKNKSLADAFHVWSREKLSAHIIKQDFDAIYCGEKYAMIEIKRSPTKTLERWTPYSDDKRNYDIQFKISQIMNAPFFTFHHNGVPCDDNTRIGCYKITSVNALSKSWISYNKEIITLENVMDKLAEATNE